MQYESINTKLLRRIDRVLDVALDSVVEKYGYSRDEFDFTVDVCIDEDVEEKINSLCSPEM